ncbi:MAG TPA: hypothetical protein VF068_05800 [Rubrobacter sp.]
MIPLFSEEAASDTISALLREDREIAVWWGTWAECTVAISRFVRENKLNEDDEATARFTLNHLGFICLDNQLRRAAEYEGFEVLPEILEYA